jgi:hypothetical protein
MEGGVTYVHGIIYSGVDKNNSKLKTQTWKHNNHSPDRDREEQEEEIEVAIFQRTCFCR